MPYDVPSPKTMIYESTRGASPEAGFEDVLLAGLAPDGGLYLPKSWPSAPVDLQALPPLTYADAAAAIIAPFTGGNPGASELGRIVSDAYRDFDHPETAPLREIGPDLHLLELFHGPTLAFKDFAMQVLSRLLERALQRRGAKATILGATSGDTGAAAVEAFRGRKDIELFILFPHGRVSDAQRRQMTTAVEDNVQIIAIEGTFDDAQAIVKALFGDAKLRSELALSAINSINWARIVAQAVYYFTSAAKLGGGRVPSFSVPTGNFGDVFAGYVAHKMGLPVERLIVATNENDILARALQTGRYEPRTVVPTDSPSMDIQISSNFERLLYEASGRDAGFVTSAMASLREKGGFDIPASTLKAMREKFSAHRISREEAASSMRALYEKSGYLIDPHTAVGLAAAEKERKEGLEGPIVLLSTAHPAKFPEAVRHATGATPECPERLSACLAGKERFQVLPNSTAEVAHYMRSRSRMAPSALHEV